MSTPEHKPFSKRAWIVASILLTLLVICDFFVHHHNTFGIEATFGFSAWYGFLTCVALVLFSKALGRILKRTDKYYDENEGES